MASTFQQLTESKSFSARVSNKSPTSTKDSIMKKSAFSFHRPTLTRWEDEVDDMDNLIYPKMATTSTATAVHVDDDDLGHDEYLPNDNYCSSDEEKEYDDLCLSLDVHESESRVAPSPMLSESPVGHNSFRMRCQSMSTASEFLSAMGRRGSPGYTPPHAAGSHSPGHYPHSPSTTSGASLTSSQHSFHVGEPFTLPALHANDTEGHHASDVKLGFRDLLTDTVDEECDALVYACNREVAEHPHQVVPVNSPCTGGVYFIKQSNGRILAVLKPGDEEAYASNNPNGYLTKQTRDDNDDSKTRNQHDAHHAGQQAHALPQWGMKAGIKVGEACVREAVAYLLDHDGFACVPPTTLVQVSKPLSATGGTTPEHRDAPLASLQEYVPHDCSGEDVGPSLMPMQGIQRIGILDVRLFNTDRHPGNILLRTQVKERKRRLGLHMARGGEFKSEEIVASKAGQDEDAKDASVSKTDLSRARSCETSNGTAAKAAKNHHQHPQWPKTLQRKSPSCRPRMTRQKSKSFHQQDFDAAIAEVKLVPIDHGYCLPSIFALDDDELDFAWMAWRQSKTPLEDDVADYVSNLDAFGDCEMLRNALGLSEDVLLTLLVSTTFLKVCVAYGLTLYQMGTIMCAAYPCEIPLALPNGVKTDATSRWSSGPTSLFQRIVRASGVPRDRDSIYVAKHCPRVGNVQGWEEVQRFIKSFESVLQSTLTNADMAQLL